MTTYYARINGSYNASPTAGDFVHRANAHTALAEATMHGGGKHVVIVVRYDAAAPGTNTSANGMIDGWAEAAEEAAGGSSIDPANFDLIVLSLRPGGSPGGGLKAYEVDEFAVVQRTVNGSTVLAGLPHPAGNAGTTDIARRAATLQLS